MKLEKIFLELDNTLSFIISIKKFPSKIDRINLKYKILNKFIERRSSFQSSKIETIKNIKIRGDKLKFSLELENLPEGLVIKVFYIKIFYESYDSEMIRLDKTFCIDDLNTYEIEQQNQRLRKSGQDYNSTFKKGYEISNKVDQIKIDNNVNSHFTNSFKKILQHLNSDENPDLKCLLNEKQGSTLTNLKTFCISLICRILLLIKYINDVSGNKIKKDLKLFFNRNILNLDDIPNEVIL